MIRRQTTIKRFHTLIPTGLVCLLTIYYSVLFDIEKVISKYFVSYIILFLCIFTILYMMHLFLKLKAIFLELTLIDYIQPSNFI